VIVTFACCLVVIELSARATDATLASRFTFSFETSE